MTKQAYTLARLYRYVDILERMNIGDNHPFFLKRLQYKCFDRSFFESHRSVMQIDCFEFYTGLLHK